MRPSSGPAAPPPPPPRPPPAAAAPAAAVSPAASTAAPNSPNAARRRLHFRRQRGERHLRSSSAAVCASVIVHGHFSNAGDRDSETAGTATVIMFWNRSDTSPSSRSISWASWSTLPAARLVTSAINSSERSAVVTSMLASSQPPSVSLKACIGVGCNFINDPLTVGIAGLCPCWHSRAASGRLRQPLLPPVPSSNRLGLSCCPPQFPFSGSPPRRPPPSICACHRLEFVAGTADLKLNVNEGQFVQLIDHKVYASVDERLQPRRQETLPPVLPA